MNQMCNRQAGPSGSGTPAPTPATNSASDVVTGGQADGHLASATGGSMNDNLHALRAAARQQAAV
ncbi:hypothetical protein PtB15_3B275 [Puccinia triticina]|nr:hypothetical protein PtB15_3B275 [Puccinia triticina]